jgi:hypothetical protein
MNVTTAAETVSLWCEGIRYVLRTRHVHVPEGDIRAALAEGQSPRDIVRSVEANQSALGRLRTRAWRVWNAWMRN